MAGKKTAAKSKGQAKPEAENGSGLTADEHDRGWQVYLGRCDAIIETLKRHRDELIRTSDERRNLHGDWSRTMSAANAKRAEWRRDKRPEQKAAFVSLISELTDSRTFELISLEDQAVRLLNRLWNVMLEPEPTILQGRAVFLETVDHQREAMTLGFFDLKKASEEVNKIAETFLTSASISRLKSAKGQELLAGELLRRPGRPTKGATKINTRDAFLKHVFDVGVAALKQERKRKKK